MYLAVLCHPAMYRAVSCHPVMRPRDWSCDGRLGSGGSMVRGSEHTVNDATRLTERSRRRQRFLHPDAVNSAPMYPQAKTPPPSPFDRASAAAEAIIGMLRVAHLLAQSRRSIDLAGLEQEIGRLCAASLDLAPAEGRAMRPLLIGVLAELDKLAAGVRALAEGAPPERGA